MLQIFTGGACTVAALRYKSECRGFDSRWRPSGLTMAPGVDPDSKRNKHEEYFLRVKAAGA
jgi:hypothetical protein